MFILYLVLATNINDEYVPVLTQEYSSLEICIEAGRKALALSDPKYSENSTYTCVPKNVG